MAARVSSPMTELRKERVLPEEFNRWAEAGRGEEMEPAAAGRIAEQMLDLVGLQPTDNVLEIGCGAGWLVGLAATRVPQGRVVGMDLSDEMVRRARHKVVGLENALIAMGGAEEIPWESNFFDKAISVESAYYWPDPLRGMREIFRVLREGGYAWVLINYYRDNPHCHQWGPLLALPTHLLSAEEWTGLLRAAGFADTAHQRIVDDTPVPEVYTGRWFRDAAQLRAFRKEGALLVHGTKPKK